MTVPHKLAIVTGSVLGMFAMASSQAALLSLENTTLVAVDSGAVALVIPILSVPIGALDLVTDVNVSITFMHDNASEIKFTLSKDAGTPVTLVGGILQYDTSGTGGSAVTVTFDDQVTFAPNCIPPIANEVDCTVNGTAPVTGTFRPEDLLAALNGAAIGNWILAIEDTTIGDPLAVTSFKLDITLADAQAQAPVPATALLLGLGLAGLAVSRKRLN